MFGSIGMPELLVIFAVALLVFGPKRLPDIGRSIGEAIRGFKKSLSEPESSSPEETERQIKAEKSSGPGPKSTP